MKIGKKLIFPFFGHNNNVKSEKWKDDNMMLN